MKEPQTITDWIFPFHHEDNKAWENANLLGRICFPAYLLMAAMRLLLYWGLFLLLLPVGTLVAISETKPAQNFNLLLEYIFKAIFCKRNEQTSLNPKKPERI